MNAYDAYEIAFRNGYNEGFVKGYHAAMLEILTEYGSQLKEIVNNIEELIKKYGEE